MNIKSYLSLSASLLVSIAFCSSGAIPVPSLQIVESNYLMLRIKGSAIDPDGGAIVLWRYNFGDGSRELHAIQNEPPTLLHNYGNPGIYSITLTVKDDQGEVGAVTNTVSLGITNGIAVRIIANYPLGSPFCFSVDGGSSESFSHPPITNFVWNFGDGSPVVSGAFQQHCFPQLGSNLITLTVTDSAGQAATRAISLNALRPQLTISQTFKNNYIVESPQPTGHFWQLQHSSNGIDWADFPSYVEVPWGFKATGAPMFFRLRLRQ